jgi:LPXTG-motif cell wall-anchored protein
LRVPLDAQVYVRSVLPGDTTQHVPKPARDLFPRVIPWWEQWWPAVAILLTLALLYWLFKRRKRKAVESVVTKPLDPYERAKHDFERLDRLALPDSGESGRFVALAVEVLRT